MPTNTNAVAITASNEHELLALEQRLQAQGVAFRAIRESDGPHAGELMAIGCAPQARDGIRKFFSSYPLLR